MLREKINLSLAQIMQSKTIYISLAQIMQTKTIYISLMAMWFTFCDLGPDMDLTWDLDLDLSLTINHMPIKTFIYN